jgi:hypothetical protein
VLWRFQDVVFLHVGQFRCCFVFPASDTVPFWSVILRWISGQNLHKLNNLLNSYHASAHGGLLLLWLIAPWTGPIEWAATNLRVTMRNGISWNQLAWVPYSALLLRFFDLFCSLLVFWCGSWRLRPYTIPAKYLDIPPLRGAEDCGTTSVNSKYWRTLKNMVDLLQTYVMSIQVSLASRGWNSSIPDFLDLQAMKNLFPSILCIASACTSAFQATHLRI